MGESITYEAVTFKVKNGAGKTATFVKTTPVVTETGLDGTSETYRKLASVKTQHGEHVNVRGEGEYETLSGEKWSAAGD